MILSDSKGNPTSIPINAEMRVRDALSAGGNIKWEEYDDVPTWLLRDFPSQLTGLSTKHIARLTARYYDLSPEEQLGDTVKLLSTTQVTTTSAEIDHMAGRTDSTDGPTWQATFPFPMPLVQQADITKTAYNLYANAFPRGLWHNHEREFLQYSPHPKLKHIHVDTQRNYLPATHAVMSGAHPHMLITGSTGSGKSTFVLAHIVQMFHALVLLPTETNLASLLYEFHTRMPDLISKYNIKNQLTGQTLKLPFVATQDISTQTVGPGQVTLATYESFNNFVMAYGDFPPHHLLIMDEYHLTTSSHAPLTRQLLLNVRRREPLSYTQRRIFMSATPMGIPAPAPVPTNVKEFELEQRLPDIISDPVPQVYTPVPYRGSRRPNPMMQILAESDEAADILATNLRGEGYKVTVLNKDTTIDEALVAFDADYTEQVYITTPETSIGTTLRINLLINPGLVAFPTFENGLLYVDRKPQGPAANVQARGRGGRTFQTNYYYFPSLSADVPEVTSLPTLADTYTLLTALCNTVEPDQELAPVLQAYPKLAYLTAPQAVTALRRSVEASSTNRSAFLRTYEVNPSGAVYSEFGGKEDGFAEHNADSFRLFVWPSGQAYCAFLNLMSDQDITATSTPALATVISKVMSSKSKGKYKTLSSALDLIARSPQRYLRGIADALAPFHAPTAPDLTVDGATGNQTFHYLFGPVVSDLFNRIGTRHITLTLTRHPDGRHLIRAIVIKIDATTRVRIVYACPSSYRNRATHAGAKGSVAAAKVEALILKALQPTIAATAVQDDPKLCTNLSNYAHLQPTSGNSWFRGLSL
jgi:hypothetical protein